MFDYHMHSTVSFDGHNTALQMALSAKNAGLREICFTDHMDYTPQMDMVFDPEQYDLAYDHLEIPGLQIRKGVEYGLTPDNCFTDHMDYTPQMDMVFDPEQYDLAYDHLEIPGLQIRKGVEYGLTPDNCQQLHRDLLRRNYDYVLGSIHMVDGVDVYMEPFWQDKTPHQAALLHLEQTLNMCWAASTWWTGWMCIWSPSGRTRPLIRRRCCIWSRPSSASKSIRNTMYWGT